MRSRICSENLDWCIETRGLTRRFGKITAVDRLDLKVANGTVCAFLGSNGAGKTTTIKMLMNIIFPTAGESRVFGKRSQDLDQQDYARIGYVSENQKLPDWMTVDQLLRFLRPMYPTWDDQFCDLLLEFFELPKERKIAQLSRGMRMKAALVSSLAYRPELLMMDEPFTGLDPLVRDELTQGILEMTQQEHWTVLISSHDIDDVEPLADTICIIHEAKLRIYEPLEGLYDRFRSISLESVQAERVREGAPATWLGAAAAQTRVSFIDSAYRKGELEVAVRTRFPDARNLKIERLTLKSIFIALLRSLQPNRKNLGELYESHFKSTP